MGNWYKEAKNGKKPFGIKIYVHGEERVPSNMEGVRIDAYSSEQARKLFLDRYPSLVEYLEMGYDVEAWFDKELWEQRETMRKLKEQSKEETIQNAWWQD